MTYSGINALIARGPQYDIPGAFQQGTQQGQQANALALATQAARSGDYGALSNALLQMGDVRGAMEAMETPYERQRQKTLDARQKSIDELNRRQIESEITARSKPARNAYDERVAAAAQLGLQPGTPEHTSFVLYGKAPEPAKPPRTGMANVDGRMQLVNLDTGEVVKDLGQAGQRNQAALPTEAAARVGLAENFQSHYPQLRKDIAGGAFSGVAGRGGLIARTGKQGEIYRDIVAGSESMTRMLTGAGMNLGEAQREVEQYLPAWNDNETTILSKLDRLSERLKAMTGKIYEGRGTGDATTPQQNNQSLIYKFNQETGDLE